MQFEIDPGEERRRRAEVLNQKYALFDTPTLLERVVREDFAGKVALVSAFGAESAVLLCLLADIDPNVPVIFLDTAKHFDETLSYRDELVRRFGLKDVRVISPDPLHLEADDPDGRLHATNPDLCCHIRKTLPMVRALKDFSCWITGRKRFQAETRASLRLFETQDRWIKVNPLADWTAEQVDAFFETRALPRHPLEAFGYFSVGCSPCTEPVTNDADDLRSGRWKNRAKTECGIHTLVDPATDVREN